MTVPSLPVTRARWAAGLAVGSLLWFVALFGANAAPSVLLGLRLEGPTYALVALLFAPLALAAVWVGLRVARVPLRQAGFTLVRARSDFLVGTLVAVAWALLQFLLLIPLTGGAERADIVVNSQQIGGTLPGLAAFVLLAWGGGFAEELYFRALLMTGLRGALGDGPLRRALVVLLPTVMFAVLHAYQGGWIGILDTGAYGGLTLSLIFAVRGRLLPCVVAHAMWNSIAAVVIYAAY